MTAAARTASAGLSDARRPHLPRSAGGRRAPRRRSPSRWWQRWALAGLVTGAASLVAIPQGAAATALIATTLAGVGVAGYAADGGIASGSAANAPTGLAVDSTGDLFIADTASNRIRMVPATSGTYYGQTMTAGDLYTIAGNGTACSTHTVAGCSYDGPATSAELDKPDGVAVDSTGDVFVADTANNWVAMLAASSGTNYGISMTANSIYVVAGTGTACSTHSVAGCSYNATATSAKLDAPHSVAVDGAGDVVVADTSNNWVGVLAEDSATLYGISMTASSIYVVAGTGTACSTHSVAGCSYNATATSARLASPAGVAVDGAGDLLVADTANNWVGMLAAASGTNYGISMAADRIYVVAGTGTACVSHNVRGCHYGGAATSAKLSAPAGVALDGAGDLFVSDPPDSWVSLVASGSRTLYGTAATANSIYVVAGTGTACSTHTVAGCSYDAPGTSALLDAPSGIAVDGSGDLIVADTSNQWLGMLAASAVTRFGVAMTVGDIYDVVGTGTAGYYGDGGYASSTPFNAPAGVAIDQTGDVFVADTANNRIRMIPATSGTFYGEAMTAGVAYTIAGNGSACTTHTVAGCSYNAAATGAELDAPSGVAVDAAGDLFVADTANNWIGMLAAASGTNYGIAMTAGDLYVVAGTGNACSTHTVARCSYNAPATGAALDAPSGVAVDAAGDLFVADTANQWVGMVPKNTGTNFGVSMTAGGIYDIFGTGTACATITGACGDTGSGTTATLNSPADIAVAPSGALVVADKGTDRVRELVSAPLLLDLPSSFTFPNFTLPGVDGVSGGVLSMDLVPSTYSLSTAPWSLAITSTTFSSGGHALSAAATTVGAPISSCDAAFSCTAVAARGGDPTFPFTVPAGAPAPAAATFFSDQSGTGPQTLSFTFQIAIPADAFAGTYTSTWTITDQSGP
ncbi:MAG TPA: hypothetical protein VNF07_05585 [Acidimicrobiales bacterium]|nr:hypothetical protein [Acidimicrobiales bacterium]